MALQIAIIAAFRLSGLLGLVFFILPEPLLHTFSMGFGSGEVPC